jgi:Flp pilus assembly protein TadG
MVEFALVGGLFFFLVFSLVNAGFFLYGRAAVQHAADVGMAAISEEGNCTSSNGGTCLAINANCPNFGAQNNADEVAICLMDQAGLTTTPLVKIINIQVWQVALNSDGTPLATCNNSGNSPGTGSLPCNTANHDQYNTSGGVSPQGWLVGTRNASTEDASFARLVINYQYSLIAVNKTVTASTSDVFRLEPQQ